MRRYLLWVFIIFICNIAYAKQNNFRCPTVEEIKNNYFPDWILLYQEGEEEASTADLLQVEQSITSFDIARWDLSYLENAHCFYKGNHPIFNRVVFARDSWHPNDTNSHWTWVKPKKLAECSYDVENCDFLE